jgi:hypothetical protein
LHPLKSSAFSRRTFSATTSSKCERYCSDLLISALVKSELTWCAACLSDFRVFVYS